MHLKKLALSLALAGIALPAAHATDGYFQPGYSVKANGMGGVGIALPQDALAAATNPAGMALIGNRVDGGLSLFRPDREASFSNFQGITGGQAGTYSGNDQQNFIIPEVGANYMINPTMSAGISLYGNGGMNSGYSTIMNSGTGLMNGAGVDLQQMFIAPSFAWKVTPTQTIGVAVNLVHQTFRANGLDNFANSQVSSSPQNVTGNGHGSSNGIGIRIGWIGELAPGFTLGATYQPKTHMSKFSKYSGLFAEGGSFDIPANYGIGFAWKTGPLTLAGDIERILYSDVSAIGNTSTSFCTGVSPTCAQLGASNGPGFGWNDVTVVKLGVAYQVNEALTVRGGWNHSDNPVTSENVFFNTIAPGVVKDHLTLGMTYAVSKNMEISADYIHAFKNTVTGTAPQFTTMGPPTGQATEKLSMSQNTLGVSVGWKF